MTKADLIKKWIQYLKNNGIVSSATQAGGKLAYNRRPTRLDLKKFLDRTTGLPGATIDKAISAAGQQAKAERELTKPRDLDVNIWNDHTRKVTESDTIKDTESRPISDAFILAVFDLIVQELNAPPKKDSAALKKILDIIDNDMLPEQRAYLWELLNAG